MKDSINAISQSGHFIIDSEEKITSQYYFTRVKNAENLTILQTHHL